MPVDDRKEPGRPQHGGYRLHQGGLVGYAVQRVGKQDKIDRLGERGGKIARIGGDPLAHGDALVLGFAARPRIRSGSKSRAYARPPTILASGAVKYPSPQHRSSAVMPSLTPLTPSVRSKPEGSGKRAAHQSRDGIDVPATCLPRAISAG